MSIWWAISIIVAEFAAVVVAYYYGKRDGIEEGLRLNMQRFMLQALSSKGEGSYGGLASLVPGEDKAPTPECHTPTNN